MKVGMIHVNSSLNPQVPLAYGDVLTIQDTAKARIWQEPGPWGRPGRWRWSVPTPTGGTVHGLRISQELAMKRVHDVIAMYWGGS